MNNYFIAENFKSFVGWSVIVHILLVGVLSFDINLFPEEDLILKNSIRVDIVDLPDKIKPPKKNPIPEPPKKIALKKSTKQKSTKIKKLKSQQANAFAKLKQAQALQRLKEEMSKRQAEKEEPKKEPVFAGNVITEGSSLSGLNKIALNKYYEKVKTHVREQWTLPQWLSELDLKAQAQVLVDERGVVISRGIYSSSGNPTFDNFVISTIDKASPLPPPPPRLSGALKSKGFVLNFPE